MTTDK